MSKVAFQGMVVFEEISAGDEPGDWITKVALSDRNNVVGPYTIQVGDVCIIDTQTHEHRTVGFYELMEIVKMDWSRPTVRVREMSYNVWTNSPPNLAWMWRPSGIIVRPGLKRGFLPVISSDTQLTTNTLPTDIQNFNFTKLLDDLEVGSDPVNGGVFVTDILPLTDQDNVGSKAYVDGDTTLIGCTSTSLEVRVKVMAISGHSNYKPKVTVNELPVTLESTADAPLFEGFIDVLLDETGIVHAKHEDGAEWVTTVHQDLPPNVLSAVFVNPYPTGQTELKENDLVSIEFTTDIEVVAYEIQDFGALKNNTGELPASTIVTINDLIVANRGDVTTPQSFKVRVQKDTGAWSEWFDSIIIDPVDGVNTVNLNNLYPTINFTDIVYPLGQLALKGNESALVNHTVENFDNVEYTSTQLGIVDSTVYEPEKLVERLLGDYNVSADNFIITATRVANGAVTTKGKVVNIADVMPVVTVNTPAARLRSGGNQGTSVQLHQITVSSTQALLEEPTLNAPEGVWYDTNFTPNVAKTNWKRRLAVHDDNIKGSFNWNSLQVKSLSGQIQTVISSGEQYVLGGFVFRKLRVDEFPNRATLIGTTVSNTSKLRCTNLSKGPSGSLNFTYVNSLVNTVDKFTIVNQDNSLNSNGTHWYNLDGANASSNTTGEMYIELEEVV